MQQPIYMLKQLDVSHLKNECALDRWFIKLVHKPVDALTVFDVARMIRQDVYLDIALPKAWDMLFEDPLAGEYDGQLIKTLVKEIELHPDRKNDAVFKHNVDRLEHTGAHFNWDSPEDAKLFREYMHDLKTAVQGKQTTRRSTK